MSTSGNGDYGTDQRRHASWREVAMGYNDGYPRAAPTGTPVLVNGREVKMSVVAMDMTVVDLGPTRRIKRGTMR